MCVNSCLPCSSEDDTPSPVCPASLLTLLSCFRCIGEQGQGALTTSAQGKAEQRKILFLVYPLHISQPFSYFVLYGALSCPPCPLLRAGPQ